MRVLITRPEREATALATALGARGHLPVIAPLFHLEFIHPPPDFAAVLVSCQAVLLTSANGARALAEAHAQRTKPVVAVGDTTAATAEGLGFTNVASAAGDGAALVELVRQRLDPKAGALVHVAGADVASDLGEGLGRDGFDVRRFTLYDAREETALPEPARAALQARALDAATFFSPRAAQSFARLVGDAKLTEELRSVTAIAISPAALAPLADLPFKAAVAARRPTRQAVLDEIDRLAEAGVQGQVTMSDTPPSPLPAGPPPAPPAVEVRTVEVRRGLGLFGSFITGLVAAVVVLAAALVSLPFWPERVRVLWRGEAMAPPAPGLDLEAVRADATKVANVAVEVAKRDLGARLDDLDKRLQAVAASVATRPAPAPDSGAAELRRRIEAMETRWASAAPPIAPAATPPAAAPSAPSVSEAQQEIATLTREMATLRTALQTLDQAVASQKEEVARQRDQGREQSKALADVVGARASSDQKALTAARASAVIGVAARLSAALESGLPFATDVALLGPLIQGDAKLGEIAAALEPYGKTGVASLPALTAGFPVVAKAAMADDLADDSFGERLLGKLKGVVSLRRVGEDVHGDTVEAKLAQAEAALHAGNLEKAVGLVKSMPPQTANATAAWLKRAEAHLAAKQAIAQLAAHAVTLLGAAR